MRKCMVCIFVILLVFSACGEIKTFRQQVDNLTDSELFYDNRSGLNSTSMICKYGSYFLFVKQDFSDTSSSIVIVDDKLNIIDTVYSCKNEIKAVKPINNHEICVLLNEKNDSYIVVNLENGSITNIKPNISDDDSMISITPYFFEDAVFLDVLSCNNGENETYHKVYKQQTDGAYSCFISNCSQFQIIDNGIVFEFGGKIFFKDCAHKEQVLLEFDLDKVFAVLVDKYIVSVKNDCYEIIDIFENNIICSTTDISHDSKGGIEGDICIADGSVYFVTLNGIEKLNLINGKTEFLSRLKPDSLTIMNNIVYFELDKHVICVNPAKRSMSVLS